MRKKCEKRAGAAAKRAGLAECGDRLGNLRRGKRSLRARTGTGELRQETRDRERRTEKEELRKQEEARRRGLTRRASRAGRRIAPRIPPGLYYTRKVIYK